MYLALPECSDAMNKRQYTIDKDRVTLQHIGEDPLCFVKVAWEASTAEGVQREEKECMGFVCNMVREQRESQK